MPHQILCQFILQFIFNFQLTIMNWLKIDTASNILSVHPSIIFFHWQLFIWQLLTKNWCRIKYLVNSSFNSFSNSNWQLRINNKLMSQLILRQFIFHLCSLFPWRFPTINVNALFSWRIGADFDLIFDYFSLKTTDGRIEIQ